MYYKDYDPTLHDIYLYGPGNTGYPIAINPNSLIAGASADFSSICPRYRSFTNLGPIAVPPGTGISYLPNYYNIGSPLMVVFGESTISSAIHYTSNKPSDTTAAGFAKYTGTTTAAPLNNVYFWNNSLTGLCGYGPWTGIYNAVPLNQISGDTYYADIRYFNGSPEIPGFASGATYYGIFSDDHGIMDLLGAGPTLSQQIAKKISIGALANDVYLQGNTIDYSYYDQEHVYVRIKVQSPDLYVWDGSDKIIPIPYFEFIYRHTDNEKVARLLPGYVPLDGSLTGSGAAGETYAAWDGDSSSQLVYKKNNSLYFLGGIKGIATDNLLFPNQFALAFSLYITDTAPLYDFLSSRLMDRNHYWYPLNQGLTLATEIDFTRIENALNNLSPSLTNLYQKFIS